MDFNKFMFELNNTLYENSFYSVELYKEYNECDETYVIRVVAKRENDEYDCNFEIYKKRLDTILINEIVNCLLKLYKEVIN